MPTFSKSVPLAMPTVHKSLAAVRSADSFPPLRDLEAARFALLMRLAPALRHGLMGQMQAMQFLAELAVRRTRQAQVPVQIAEVIAKMPSQTALMTARCQSLTRWLDADPGHITDVKSIVDEVSGLLDVEFSLRERQLNVLCSGANIQILRAPLVEVVAGALLALSDESSDAGVFTVTATSEGEAAVVQISAALRSTGDVAAPSSYRNMTWDDVRAIAGSYGIALEIENERVRIVARALSKDKRGSE